MDEFLRDVRAVSIPLRGMQTNHYGVIGALLLNSFKTLMTKRRKRDEKEIHAGFFGLGFHVRFINSCWAGPGY